MIHPFQVLLGVDTVIIAQVSTRSNTLGLRPRPSISLAFTFKVLDALVISGTSVPLTGLCKSQRTRTSRITRHWAPKIGTAPHPSSKGQGGPCTGDWTPPPVSDFTGGGRYATPRTKSLRMVILALDQQTVSDQCTEYTLPQQCQWEQEPLCKEDREK